MALCGVLDSRRETIWAGAKSLALCVYCLHVISTARGGSLSTQAGNDTGSVSTEDGTAWVLTDTTSVTPPTAVRDHTDGGGGPSRGAGLAPTDKDGYHGNSRDNAAVAVTMSLLKHKGVIQSAARTLERVVEPSNSKYIPSWDGSAGGGKTKQTEDTNTDNQGKSVLPSLLDFYQESRAKNVDDLDVYKQDKSWLGDSHSAQSRYLPNGFHGERAPSATVATEKEVSRAVVMAPVAPLAVRRSNPGHFSMQPCVMWLGSQATFECCTGLWYDWPTCHCIGFSSCKGRERH